MSLGRWLLMGVLGCASCQAQDVVFHLRNGDRITGRLVSETTNGVVVATSFSDKVPIAASLIERREVLPVPDLIPAAAVTNRIAVVPTNRPPAAPASGVVGELILTNQPSMAQTAGGAAKTPEPPPPKPEPKPEEKAAPKSEEKAVPKPAEKAAPKPEPSKPPEPSALRKFIAEWNGEAQIGANIGLSTTERKSFTGLIKLTHNRSFTNDRHLRNILNYDASYGTTDDVLSDNRMDGSWKVEYDLNKRFLLYNASRAGYDEVRALDFQYDFGPGLGYKWVVLTNFVFKSELGGDYQEQFFAGDTKTSRYSLRIAEDMWWQITAKLRWDEKIEFFPEVRDPGDYRIRLETNLSYLLKQNLTLTLNLVDLYDTHVPEGVSRNDLQIRSLLGIKF